MVKNTNKRLKNAERIQEGIKFQKEVLDETRKQYKNVTGRVRLVPKNGQGNKKGNRTDTDILIMHEDGTYEIIETKLTDKLKLSPG